MSNGTMTQPPALDPSLQVTDVPPSRKERVFGALGGVLGAAGADTGKFDEALQRHHESRLNEARMHRQNAATAAGVLMTGIDPQSGAPLSPERERYFEDLYKSAMEHYNKVAGVSKEHKGAISKAKDLLDRIIGARKQQAQGEQPQGGGTAPAAGARGAMPQPPAYDDELTQMQMPELREQVEAQREITAGTRKSQAAFGEREREAEKIGLRKGTREYAEFVGTGKMTRGARLQKAVFENPKTGEVEDGSYDPDSGQYSDQQGNVVEGAKPATTASMTPKEIHYLSPDGKPLFGFRVGMKLYDQQGQELPPGTEFFTRGMLPTETLRQVITYDAQGNPQINTLETMRTPIAGGKTAGGSGAAPSGTGGQRIPQIKTPAPGKDVTGKPLGMSAGMQKAQVQRATAVREANTQVFGDPANPNFKPLKDFAYLADDPRSRERLGTALKLTFDGLEQEEKQHGSLIALIQAYGGVPQALASAKAGVQRDVIDQLSPEEQDAFDATISSFSSVVGLRSLTSASAAQFSVRALERDLPIIGVTADSSRQFNDKLSHIGEIAYNGAKTLSDAVMPPQEKQFYLQRLEEVRGGPRKETAPIAAPTKKGAMKAPPKAQTSTDDEILELAGAVGKKKSGKP